MIIKSELEEKCNKYLQRRLHKYNDRLLFSIKIGKCVYGLWEFIIVENENFEIDFVQNFATQYKNAVDILIAKLIKNKEQKNECGSN